MINHVIRPAKPRLFPTLCLAGLLALLATLLPASFAHAATATATGPLTVTLTSDDSGVVGQPLAFTITVSNASADPITDVLLSVWFPAQLVGAVPNPDACGRARHNGSTTQVTCSAGTLQPGTSFSIPLTLLPSLQGSLTIQGEASGVVGGVFSRVGLVLPVPIAPAPTDVQVTGSASTGSPARGANFHYTFQVKNSGSQPANGVTFTDSVPAGETLIAAGTDNFAPCTLSGGTVICSLGDMATGAQVLVTVGVGAPTQAATLTNTGSAFATNGDTQPSNNSFSVTVQVR